MAILVTICARGGSKGLPKKNILPLNGMPLIHYSIKIAQRLQKHYPDTVIELSTDSQEIQAVAQEAGLKTTYTRPNPLASDTSGKIAVIEDLLRFSEKQYQTTFDFIIDLDVSAPLRTVEDVHEAFEMLQAHNEALNIFSVSEARKNPYFNMVEPSGKGDFVQLVKQKEEVLGRQAAPAVYEMNASFYIYKRSFFTQGCTSAVTSQSLAYVMEHTCFDIDSREDFNQMEYMLQAGIIPIDFGQLKL